jgi:hypothetical protein
LKYDNGIELRAINSTPTVEASRYSVWRSSESYGGGTVPHLEKNRVAASSTLAAARAIAGDLEF